ncbi:MAG: glycosyltransferase family 4 protein [Desulfocucumaceae bacterium]
MISSRADYGGGPEHLLTLVRGLAKNYRLFVACPREEPYWPMYQSLLKGERMLELPHRRFSVSVLVKMLLLVRSGQIDIVHSHGRGAGAFSRLLKIFFPGLKVVHTFHGLHYENRSFGARAFYIGVERVLGMLTDVFICVSRGELSEAVDLGICRPEQASVIYNGILPASFPGDAALPGVEAGDFVVLHISRFDQPKNSGMALQIAERLFRQDPGVKFVFVGDGPEKQKLERAAKNKGLSNVLFLGFETMAGRYCRLAQVYLSTSKKEGLGIAAIEALSAGLPVIATDVPGSNEIVDHGENGFLFSKEDVDWAVGHILKLKYNPALLKLLGENAIKKFKDCFQQGDMILKLEKVYRGE